jgi:hypothetical protein
MGFWSMGERIGYGSGNHDGKIFICDVYGDLLAICIISTSQIRILLHQLIQSCFYRPILFGSKPQTVQSAPSVEQLHCTFFRLTAR